MTRDMQKICFDKLVRPGWPYLCSCTIKPPSGSKTIYMKDKYDHFGKIHNKVYFKLLYMCVMFTFLVTAVVTQSVIPSLYAVLLHVPLKQKYIRLLSKH